METQKIEQIERERKELEDKMRKEWGKHFSKRKSASENFKASLAYGLVPASLATLTSYLCNNSEQTEALRQVASWAYMLVSPFIIITGMRYAREDSAYSLSREVIRELNNPGKSNLGFRE